MKYFQLLLLCFVATLSMAQHPSHNAAKNLIDQTVHDGFVKGIAGGYSIGGITQWSQGSGFADKENLFTEHTISRIASIAKPITAIAILQLVETGMLSLDTLVSSILPEFAQGQKAKITVKHILQHSSGIGAYKNKKENNNTKQYKDLQQAMELFVKRDLLHEPGSAFAYTSYGYVVLGRIIEVVSEQSYANYLDQYIFKPAGMLSTSIETHGQILDQKACLYHQKKQGKIKRAKHTNLSDRIPGGGIQSTVADLLALGNAILSHQLISKESFALMTHDYGLKKEGNGYGLGFYLYGENPKHGIVYGHSGGQIGCSSFMMLLPEIETVAVVLSNTSGALQQVSDCVVRLFYMAGEQRD